MRVWTENASDIFGNYDRKVSMLALAQLFSVEDARLTGITVQGDPIVDLAAKKIRTRSSAAQNPIRYTTVTLPVKIVKCLIQE